MNTSKWSLEIAQVDGSGDRVAKLEFASLPSLRIALTENRGKRFIVMMPTNVTG